MKVFMWLLLYAILVAVGLLLVGGGDVDDDYDLNIEDDLLQ